MMPPAPGRFSTSTGCRNASLTCFATMRPAMSAPEPGVSGTMILIGRVGYSCAAATPVPQAIAAATASLTMVFIFASFVSAPDCSQQHSQQNDEKDDHDKLEVGEPFAARGKRVQLCGDRVHFLVAHRAGPGFGLLGRHPCLPQ